MNAQPDTPSARHPRCSYCGELVFDGERREWDGEAYHGDCFALVAGDDRARLVLAALESRNRLDRADWGL